MSTNKVQLKTVDQFMADYKPVYQPVFPLLFGKSKQYAQIVGKVTNKRLNAVGDIRNKHITPKDTDVHQIASSESQKIFKKYFLGGQYTESSLQDHEGSGDVIAQALDEHNKHQDDLLFLGEGTSASTMFNNGLFWSNDPNYLLNNSIQIAKGVPLDHLADLHTQMSASATVSDKIAGRKLMLVYGSTAIAKLKAVYSSSPVVFQKVLADALGANWSIVPVPSDIALTGNGWLNVNLDQIMLHYTVPPQVTANGIDEKNSEVWWNFLMGSMMVEVLALYGINRQPVTFEA